MGLLEHLAMRRRTNELRVFPDLKMSDDGYYSSTYSKYYKRFLESLNVKHDKNSFHSFRHSFEDACRNSGVSAEIMNALQGHSESGMAGRYGSGYNLSVLDGAIRKITYPNLDLSHLHKR